MPEIAYEPKKFRAGSVETIRTARSIIAEYQQQGYSLTLRQLYYQFVARGLIENTERSYKRIGKTINDARMAGRIDWNAIEDRTRWLRSQSHWDNPAEIIRDCAEQFQVDMWGSQTFRPEVWIEKDALTGVISGVCEQYDVPYFACRGYVSQSAQWRAGQRFLEYIQDGQVPVIFHFGDHDPSGMDMTRDNQDRLLIFAEASVAQCRVRRLALNMDQVEQYNPPPNPAKLTDTRARDYIDEYGSESWELDALEPAVITKLIEDNIRSLIQTDEWDAALEEQREAREQIREIANGM